MRLWHKDLIPYLPRQQLIAQWRECCAICSNWANKGTPNHILVNKVMNYSKIEFLKYSDLIIKEITFRDYKISKKSFDNFINRFNKIGNADETIIGGTVERIIFEDWHNDRYLKQCLMNLQEKYDCGGISDDEWKVLEKNFNKLLK